MEKDIMFEYSISYWEIVCYQDKYQRPEITKKRGGDPKSDKKEKDGQIFLGTECSGEVQNIPFLFL